MSIFLLTPVERNASDWALSTTNEPVQVEAETEERARRRASSFFAPAAHSVPSSRREQRSAPWDQRQLVTARMVEKIDPAVRLILAGDRRD
jgi:SH3-like domain-containing protein